MVLLTWLLLQNIIEKLKDKITNLDEIKAYQTAASLKSDFERSELNKDKTGVEIKGIKAINPATGKEIPIWVSDYVLITYGTGAIMAVPAHDERDYAFATKFGLDIVPVIEGGDVSKEAYSGDGVHINSDFLNGMNKQDAIAKMISWIEEKGIGRPSTYSPTITTIIARGYVLREKKQLVATELGMIVTDLMKEYFSKIFLSFLSKLTTLKA